MERFKLGREYFVVPADIILPFVSEIVESLGGKTKGMEVASLRKVINEIIEIDGFRKGKIHTAPKHVLQNKISIAVENNPIIIALALDFLASSRQAKIDTVKPWVAKQVKSLKFPKRKGDSISADEIDFDEERIREIANNLVEEIQKSGTLDDSPEEIRLAVWINLVKMLTKENDKPQQEGWTFWEDLIERVEQIPYYDPRWESFEQFLDKLYDIREAKEQEREATSQRDQLGALLHENRNKLIERATFFEIGGVEGWDLANVSTSSYQEVEELLRDLLDELDQFDNLEQRKPQTISQKQELDQAINDSIGVITYLFEELSNFFNAKLEKKEESSPGGETQPEPPCQNGDLPVKRAQIDEPTLYPEVPEEKSPEPVEPQKPPEAASQTAKTVDEILELPSPSTQENIESPDTERTESPQPTVIDEIAQPIAEDPFAAQRQKVFELIDNLEFAKAYWYLWAWEKLENESFMPPSLPAALQGTWWLLGMYPYYPLDYPENLRQLVKPEQLVIDKSDYFQTVLTLSVGSIMNLMPNSQGWEGWLDFHSPIRSEAFRQLLEEIQGAHQQGIVLDPAILEVVLSEGDVEERIQSLSNQVQQWLERSLSRKAAFFRAGQVWQTLLHSRNGELYLLLSKVANNEIQNVDQVSDELKNWRDRSWLDRLIQRKDKEVTERKHRRPIDGDPREQIIGWIQDGCNLAEQWVKVVRQFKTANTSKHNWLYERTREFCDNSKQLIESTLSDLESQNVGEPSPKLVSRRVLSYFLSALQQIVSKGIIENSLLPKPPLAESELETYHFERNFATSLYYFPEIKFDANGLPESDRDNCQTILNLLDNESSRQAEVAIDGWINKHEYQFMSYLLEHCQDRAIWQSRIEEAYSVDLQKLPELIEQLDAELQQSLIDGLVSDSEYIELNGQLESQRKNIKTKETNGRQYIGVSQIYQKLDRIKENLLSKREKRLKSLDARWKTIKLKLDQYPETDEIKELTITIEKAFEKAEIRVIDEYLSLLESRDPIDVIQMIEHHRKDKETLLEFNEWVPKLISILEDPNSQGRLYQLFRNDRDLLGVRDYILPPNFPTPRRIEARDAITAWLRLKKSDHDDNDEFLMDNLITLMKFLGFSLATPKPISRKATLNAPSNFIHWRVSGSLADPLVAQFGSERKGVYDVIGVWQRPGFDVISSELERIIQNYTNQPVILFFFGWLPINIRKDLFYFARKDNIPMLVIDEVLIFFLARRLDSRSRAMFLCTLPYASINPYFPAAAGATPPEIFRGREDALKKVLDFYGHCIVYGGRQFGKSTLLHEARRRFHQPEHKQFVLYVDIRNIGAPTLGRPYVEEFISRLKSGLAEISFPITIRSNQLQGVIEEIKNAIVKNDLRLLLLLDEADNFLDADAKSHFEVIQNLKNLMDSSERRFKVVVAGLHNVQRFQRISNQPLAHLGPPIEIGPLEPNAALQLLMEPLTQIGYRFHDENGKEDPTILFHVLSYTNYHPGLIQTFAYALVEHLRIKYQASTLPPLSITRADVEKVYRKREVREAIRDRFKWTLSLDHRYEAIVLSLIVEQLDDQNGFDRLYSSSEIFKTVEFYKPRMLENEGMLTGLLDELCGLGVLTRAEEGSRYRLRSPNLVNLLGTRDEIFDYLASLEITTPESKIQMLHPQLEDGSFSPLDLASEQQIYTKRTSGVVLIFGSPAAGLYEVPSAVRRTLPKDGQMVNINIVSQSGIAIKQQLEKYRESYRDSSYLIALREMAAEPLQLLEQVENAINFCNRYRSNPILRVVFTFDPMATWQWYQIPQEQRLAVEERVDVVMSLDLWTKTAIQYSAESRWGDDVFHSDNPFKKIYNLTHGWHSLLSDLFEHYFDPKNPDNSIERYRQTLEGETERKKKFLVNLGLETIPQQVVNLMIKESIASIEDPDLLELMQIEFSQLDVALLGAAIEYLRRLRILSLDNQIDPVVRQFWSYE